MDSALTAFVTLYGVVGALSSLLQVRRMMATRSSDDVSVLFLLVYTGGFVVWLTYGLIKLDVALIVVDAVGLLVALTTLSVALRLRMVERGQGVWQALRDEAASPPPQLQWLGVSSSRPRRLPPGLEVSNRCYPVMSLPAGDDRPQLKALSGLSLTEPAQSLLVGSALAWRRIDAPEPDVQDYRAWRQSLAASLQVGFAQPARPDFLSVASQELRRPEHLKPVAARLSACRAASVWAASLHLPAAQLQFARAEQLGAYRLDALTHRWAEQALGSVALQQAVSPSSPAGLPDLLEPLSELLDPQSPLLLADPAFSALLWPASAAAGPLLGGPDPRGLPLLPEAWLDDVLAVRRAYLLSARPRSRPMAISPLDRSLHEAWVVLCQAAFIGEQGLQGLYVLERGLLEACGLQAGLSPRQLCLMLLQVDVAEGGQALAAACGLSLQHLGEVYEENYLDLAWSLLPDASPQRSAACWQALLG